MAWKNTEFERFGVVKIEGNKVMVYKDQFTYSTISVNKQITSANWVNEDLIITMTDGEIRRYTDQYYYTLI